MQAPRANKGTTTAVIGLMVSSYCTLCSVYTNKPDPYVINKATQSYTSAADAPSSSTDSSNLSSTESSTDS